MGAQWLSGRECLTLDRGASGSSLTALWFLSKTNLSLLVLVQPRKTRPRLTERLLMGRKESNQTNKQDSLDNHYSIREQKEKSV